MAFMLRRPSAVCLLNLSVAAASCAGDQCHSPTTQGNALLSIIRMNQTQLSKALVEDESEQRTMDRVLATERMNSSADIISVASYETRADIPGGCLLEAENKVPDAGRCLFSDQCVNNVCCPTLKVCNPPMTVAQVEADPLIKSIMWNQSHGGASTCGKEVCDTCDFYGDPNTYQCKEVNGGPLLQGTPHAAYLPLWNIKDPACKCDARFIAAFEAGTWVEQCKDIGTSGSNGGSGEVPPAATTRTPTPAPAACEDSATYKDPHWSDSCTQWAGFHCTEYSFSDDLIANCPVACRAC